MNDRDRTNAEKTADALDDSAYEQALTTQDVITRDLGNGERYTFAHRFDDISSGETVRVFAQNPAAEEIPILAGYRQIVSEGSVRGKAFTNVTQDTAGTEQSAGNDLVRPPGEAPTPSVIDWETGGTYSDATNGMDILSPGGTAVGARGGGVGIQAIGRIRPGANLLWELESQSNSNDILFLLVYSEIRD